MKLGTVRREQVFSATRWRAWMALRRGRPFAVAMPLDASNGARARTQWSTRA
jgi:hypothetical protein